ncbi:hypothetical protein [Xanthobacter autotrophicus]|uniref:hypothetical protein n=1 Tax=Xanthobacter autotrophicus TaxID=280 RepID=UPI003728EB31
MQNKPKNLREAMEQVRGGAAAEKSVPQNLGEALALVRSPAKQEPKPPAAPAKPAAKPWWERR